MIKIRRFNEAGIEAFRTYLADLKQNPKASPPPILEDEQYASEAFGTPIYLAPKLFDSRLALRSGLTMPWSQHTWTPRPST